MVKILGHGAFRKRVIEMGFVRGREVKVLLDAPLKDPIKYELLGYAVSLRRAEAEMIEVIKLITMMSLHTSPLMTNRMVTSTLPAINNPTRSILIHASTMQAVPSTLL